MFCAVPVVLSLFFCLLFGTQSLTRNRDVPGSTAVCVCERERERKERSPVAMAKRMTKSSSRKLEGEDNETVDCHEF